MLADHFVLAGGGHTHALILLRWVMRPDLRPKGLITLVSKNSTTLYSGMVPGLIAGQYKYDELSIELRHLTSQAGVAFVSAKIVGLDLIRNCLLIDDRPPLYFSRLSLNVGAETLKAEHQNHSKKNNLEVLNGLDMNLRQAVLAFGYTNKKLKKNKKTLKYMLSVK